jgi:hypothetical protein
MPSDTNLKINISDFTSPTTYYNNITTISQQLPSILDDFTKYYVFYNNVPDYPEYQTMFENIKQNINSLNSQLFQITNDVDSGIEKINKSLLSLNALITTEKSKNTDLKQKLGMLNEENKSTFIMITNYDQIYDLEYLKNWSLVISIFFSLYVISVVFKKQNNVYNTR